MKLKLIVNALLLLTLSVAIAAGPRERAPVLDLKPVSGLKAKVVRAGCGRRLYFGEHEIIAAADECLIRSAEPSPWIRVTLNSVLVRRPKREEWFRVDAPSALLFPELFGAEVLAERRVDGEV